MQTFSYRCRPIHGSRSVIKTVEAPTRAAFLHLLAIMNRDRTCIYSEVLAKGISK